MAEDQHTPRPAHLRGGGRASRSSKPSSIPSTADPSSGCRTPLSVTGAACASKQRLRHGSRSAASPPRTPKPAVTTQPRPSSRARGLSSSRAASPTKSSVARDRTPGSRPARPLWNSGKPNTASALNPSLATPTRPSSTRPSPFKPVVAPPASEFSFESATFVSAASAFDENRQPSPSKAKDGRLQPSSLLSGLGFGRVGHGKAQPLHSTPPNSASLVGPALKEQWGTASGFEPGKEPVKAYLRIRPPNAGPCPPDPYIEILNDSEVILIPPVQFSAANLAPQDNTRAKYKFTRVYGPAATQQEFFRGTCLPLVQDLLDGRSSLCFAYGVTASGKTYTVQGGPEVAPGGGSMTPGLLPRTVDVLFNSIGPNQTELRVRPARLTGIETAPLVSGSRGPKPLWPSSPQEPSIDHKDQTILLTPPNLDYGVWVSYAEIYNEKIYDLLDSDMDSSASGTTFQSFTANLAEQVKNAAQLLHSKASSSGGIIKRKALVLKHDKSNGSKYIHGLTEVRVRNAEEAKAVLRHGQVNRTVFSTYANRTSSRSHGIFTIKLLHLPKNVGLSESLLSVSTVSRLSIVDLAGSERSRNTQTTGDRLKEAGNINKSLMVLGQCMETLRKNQELKERRRKEAIVPFRHSKLTEIFQSFFTGEGKTVMIVNVNPCDTGFDENSNVMKFSAVASEVVTAQERRANARQDQAEVAQSSAEAVHASVFMVEEEEEAGELDGEADEANPQDGFVDHLLDQLAMLRVKLVEAEIRAAMIEAEVRDQVMQEYNQRMIEMEELFAKNLEVEAKEAEQKADRKIDIFNRATQHVSFTNSNGSESDEEMNGSPSGDRSPGVCPSSTQSVKLRSGSRLRINKPHKVAKSNICCGFSSTSKNLSSDAYEDEEADEHDPHTILTRKKADGDSPLKPLVELAIPPRQLRTRTPKA